MKKIWTLTLPLLLLFGCGQAELEPLAADPMDSFADRVEHGMIELGDKLADPYAVANMQAALNSLYPTKAGRVDVQATDLYVRFLPRTDEELRQLRELGIPLLDHPVDYRIVREGDYYHDPSLAEDAITWQYSVVGKDFAFPAGIVHELLEECYIAEHDPVTRAGDGIDWAAVERDAYRLTGNEALCPLPTKATTSQPVQPEGRISIIDPAANGGQAFGVAGVQVSCNAFVKFSSTYTDRDGYYRMPKSFSSKLRYRLVFTNAKKFHIGLNLLFVPASVSTMGKGEPAGMDLCVEEGSDGALFRRCVVNNAAYEFFDRCHEEDLDIAPPPTDLQLWIVPFLDPGCAPMLHRGTHLDLGRFKDYVGDFMPLIRLFLPDIILGTKGKTTYRSLYTETVHQLAHASHYVKAGDSYWKPFTSYMLGTFLATFGRSFGDGTGEGAGYCEMAQMWAYYLEGKLYEERYGEAPPSFGMKFWFYPQIFRYLDERGLTPGDIFRVLGPTVSSRESLQQALEQAYPEMATVIAGVFERYGG